MLADNCQYWIGESYFGLKEYQQAIMEFQKVFAYSMTDKYDDAQLMIGLSYVRSGQKEKAQKEFETFLNTYAGSEYAGVARRYYRDI
ncbi:MAG: Tetratricopeptide repeat protein [bacterium ADurb.Bin478]|nr:MAG: Tetratricopeptide repeat protein [bacterium ADurb.Bin478]